MFTNGEIGENFGKEIESKLKNAIDLEVASGFFSYKLLERLTPTFKQIAKKGSCKLLFGMIFHDKATKSQKKCLIKLNNELKKINKDSGVFITIQQYHGKIFRIVEKKCENIYIGSSNLSYSGFKTYKEFNLLVKDNKDQLLVKHFLKHLFNETDPKKKIGFPLDAVDLQLKSQTYPTTLPKKTLANFEIPKSKFPKTLPKNSLIIKHRPSEQLRSSLNLYFDKGRKNKSGKYSPRPWYEIEITSEKNERLDPWYPKGDWTAFVNDDEKYYKLEMVTSSGDPKSPKAIQSKNGRNILGELIKGRLERKNVLKKFEQITQEILDDYGKDYIELKKIKHGVYVMVI